VERGQYGKLLDCLEGTYLEEITPLITGVPLLLGYFSETKEDLENGLVSMIEDSRRNLPLLGGKGTIGRRVLGAQMLKMVEQAAATRLVIETVEAVERGEPETFFDYRLCDGLARVNDAMRPINEAGNYAADVISNPQASEETQTLCNTLFSTLLSLLSSMGEYSSPKAADPEGALEKVKKLSVTSKDLLESIDTAACLYAPRAPNLDFRKVAEDTLTFSISFDKAYQRVRPVDPEYLAGVCRDAIGKYFSGAKPPE
jgi:hypothetical protein